MVNFGKKSVLLSVLLASVSIVYVEAGKNGELRGRSFSQEETTSIDVTSPESETPTMEETPMNAAQGGERALNGRAKEMKAMVTKHETTFEAPSTEVMDNFMTEHHMMKGVSLPMQKISKRNTIKVNGAVHSLDNLIPMNVFSSDATYLDEGVPKPLPMAATFMKVEGDSTMLVTKEGPRGNVKTIDITYTDGSNMYMEEVSNGVLAVMLPEARDKEAMKQFIMADPQVSGESGGTSSDPGRKLTKDYDSSLNENERHLQSGCSSLKVIDIAIAYDSSFCAKAGGSGNANNAVQQIVARASTLYQNNFCGKIQISHMEGFCDPNTDPYAAGVRLNQSGCGNSGLLQFFSGYWSTNRGSVRRDTAHLFSGTGLECSNDGCVIGCANVANLCSSSSSYGVDYIAFSSDGQMQANLFAHELAHNAGSDHDADTDGVEWIMEPFINSGTNGFSSQSRSSISNLLASSSCISTESPGGPSTSPFVAAPVVAAPVAAAPITAAPVADSPFAAAPVAAAPVAAAPVAAAPVAVSPVADSPSAAAPVAAAPFADSPSAAAPVAGGTCANGQRGNGKCPDPNLCCSEYGWCGTGTAYCGSSQASCGNGNRGNGMCTNSDDCCSQWGWCINGAIGRVFGAC